jgi:hypothetical protein
MQFLVLKLMVHILTTRLNVVPMRNGVLVPNTEKTVTTAHRLGVNITSNNRDSENRECISYTQLP